MMRKIYSFLGDFYHSHEHIYAAVRQAADSVGEYVCDSKLCDIGQVLDENPDAIILACENRINPEDETINLWLTPELDEKITSYVKNGGRIVALHAALASYPLDSKYVDMIKGYFVSHPPQHYLVRYKSSDERMPCDYEVLDEHYVLHVDTANTNVFMALSSEYGQGYAGWRHNYGKGKVIAMALTHNKEGLEHPQTIRLIGEGLAWALRD